MSIPKTKQRNAFPGDVAVVFQQPAKDSEGRVWPKGTEMNPLSGGFDNVQGCQYVRMSGATFYARD